MRPSGGLIFSVVYQPALSSTRMMILLRPAPISRAKASRVFSKASMLTVLKRYQTTPPELGSTKP